MKRLLQKLLPEFVFSWYHLAWAFCSALFYGFPSKKLKVIGVTGTDGKTTTVYLISQMLNNLGSKTAFFSSAFYGIGNKTWENEYERTMPGWYILQSFLKKAVKANCQYVVLEVASEGIRQHRHRFIDFQTAVLTNLSPEHIERHQGFKNYKKAKGKLFKAVGPKGVIIVNQDDENRKYFLSFPAQDKKTYGFSSLAQVSASECQVNQKGISFKVQGESFHLDLMGRFNISNALAAICVGLSEGFSLKQISSAFKNIKPVPGRMEIIIKEPLTVIVDYALTPNALEKLYSTIKEIFTGRLIGVLGAAGGGRDRWKRPKLGKIASLYLDKIILTSEDPYDEKPEIIIDQIAQRTDLKKIEKIIDRRKAIARALKIAQPGDVVIITGKGGDQWMHLPDDKKIPWDDREVVKEESEKIVS